jgi:hypothetical protein
MPIDPSALLNLWSLEELPACGEGMEHARAFRRSGRLVMRVATVTSLAKRASDLSHKGCEGHIQRSI